MMKRLASALSTQFANLAPRERWALRIACLFVPCALAWMIGDWMIAERTRLDRQLPALILSVQMMERDAAELAHLRRSPSPTSPAGPAELAASAMAHGLVTDIRVEEAAVIVSGSSSLERLLPWLAELHSRHRLRVSELDFDAGNGRFLIRLDPTALVR
ncbi:type II secretion system protein GspM [Thauera mechernichensis]|uniref:Type II secretion system protein GspM n=1 Tax=Thauera mechernichensis TaxID=82788 RepID=A0ABW3WD60_9RHOO|nr:MULTISPECIES: type II secretion system protein GspM [Thauera]ENO80845.1 hypothetical protein B447_10278 [Thauera sp. 27]MDG3065079.1 type II secretion system protein GspM [Thauera mechernichensis]